MWWVPHVVRKREVILYAVKSRLRKTTHKFGIEIPTSIKDAERIDLENGNNFWRNAISLEMHNVGVVFELLKEDQKAPHGWNRLTGHLIFDIKMDFTRKARWVLDGHKTPDIIV